MRDVIYSEAVDRSTEYLRQALPLMSIPPNRHSSTAAMPLRLSPARLSRNGLPRSFIRWSAP